MTKAEIMETQARVGTLVDGFWGSKSIAATQRHLRGMTPKRFPTQRQVQSGRSAFGAHGEPSGSYSPPTKKIALPFKLKLYGAGAARIGTISPHELCADAMLGAFQRMDEEFTDDELADYGLRNYFGIYNPRRIRGGSTWSMHSWAIAIDIDANRNTNGSHWPVRSKMPVRAMECFAREGWLSAGAAWSRDAMHFQATSR